MRTITEKDRDLDGKLSVLDHILQTRLLEVINALSQKCGNYAGATLSQMKNALLVPKYKELKEEHIEQFFERY